MNYNILVFIGFIIMALSVLGIAVVNDEDFSKFGWLVFCVGLRNTHFNLGEHG